MKQTDNVSLSPVENVARSDSRGSVDGISSAAVSVTIWFLIEAQTSTIAACLPMLAALFHSNQNGGFAFRIWQFLCPTKKSLKVNSKHIRQENKDERRPWEHLRSDPSQDRDVAGNSSVELKVVAVI